MTNTIRVNRNVKISINDIPTWLNDFVADNFTYKPYLIEKWSIKETDPNTFYLIDFSVHPIICIEVKMLSPLDFTIKLINKVPIGYFLVEERHEEILNTFASTLNKLIRG